MKTDKIISIFKKAAAEKRTVLTEAEVYEILDHHNINTPPRFFIPVNDTEITTEISDGDLILKVVSPTILHKTDVGGVRKTCASRLKNDLKAMKEKLTEKGLLPEVHSFMVCNCLKFSEKTGHELLVSAKSDRAFGEVIALGFGGTDTEYYAKWLKEGHSVRFFSCENPDLRPALTDFPPAMILDGRTRGSKESVLPELLNFLQGLSTLMRQFSYENTEIPYTIEEIEINPVVLSDGKFYALDGLLKFSQAKTTPCPRPVQKIKNLLYPQSAAIVGVSQSRMNLGRVILNNLLKDGRIPTEKIFVLNPKAPEIDGCKCVANFHELPEKVDLAVITVPAAPAAESLQELISAAAAESVILIPGGLGETTEGKAIQKQIETQIAESRQRPDQGPVINGGNCLGIVSNSGGYNTFFVPAHKLPFEPGALKNVALISQSGAFLVTENSRQNKIIEPRFAISYGNQMDLTVCDFLDFLKNDPEIDVFGIYVEGFKELDGKRLLQLAGEIKQKGKTIVFFKGGRTAQGAAAAASHTASIAGEFGICRDLLLQSGILIANELDEFDELLCLFAALAKKQKALKNVAVVTNAGFEATRAADCLGKLQLADISTEIHQKISAILPPGLVDIHNPLDTTPSVEATIALEAGKILLQDQAVDALLFSSVPVALSVESLPPSDSHKENIYRENSLAHAMIDWFHESEKPVIFCFDAGPLYDPLAQMLKEAGAPVFRRIDRALAALQSLAAE
jgi:acyl-CoA synthetase (NDP forming)